LPHSQILDKPEKLAMDKQSGLLCLTVVDEEKCIFYSCNEKPQKVVIKKIVFLSKKEKNMG
jgi:hypothetical protein